MSRAITIVSGIPRLRGVYASTPQVYDTSIVVGGGGITAGTPIELPNNQTYTDLDLQVFLNGSAMTPVVDWGTVGGTPRSSIAMTFDLVEGDQLRYRIDVPTELAGFCYDQSVVISGTLTTGTPITLPSSAIYYGKELIVILNGQDVEVNTDYSWVGSGEVKTQISFLYDLYDGDRVRFRIQPV